MGFVGKLSDDWECTAEVVREPVKKVFDISLVFKKEYKDTWQWNEEVHENIQRMRLAKKKCDSHRDEENRQVY